MKLSSFTFAALLTVTAAVSFSGNSFAQQKNEGIISKHYSSGCYRRDGEDRCKRGKVGGYSFDRQDAFISAFEIRQQTGPFDSGFFFDSGSSNELVDSPYLNESPYLN